MADDEAARRSVSERSSAAGQLMAADIIQLANEYPQYEPEVVGAMFEALLRGSGRVPTYDEARGYLERYATSMTNADLRDVYGSHGLGESTVHPDDQPSRDVAASAPAPRPRRGRPAGTTTTIRNDDEYRRRWDLYLEHCRQGSHRSTLSGFSTWTGTDVDSGAEWPISTIKDYRRRAKERGKGLPPT
jgi:hypothetical protein